MYDENTPKAGRPRSNPRIVNKNGVGMRKRRSTRGKKEEQEE